jgi:hypothetical protein
VRIGFGAVPDAAGVRYRAHTPKPYARAPADVCGHTEPVFGAAAPVSHALGRTPSLCQSEPAWLLRTQWRQRMLVFTRRLRHLDHLLDAGIATHRGIDDESIGIRIAVIII